MGFYRDQILPRVIDKALGSGEIMTYRSEATEGLTGDVVEIGFGSGLNMPVYPPEVTKVYAVDPAVVGRKLAADRVAAAEATVEYVGLDGQALPLDDDSCDSGLSTFTLCTIPDESAGLDELRRVVKPGGAIHLLEHGLSRDEKVQRWQHRINPVQRRLFDGCHLDRDHVAMVEDAGLEITSTREWYAKGPKPVSAFYLMRCRVPD
ncbi:MAG: methyltransferase [Acidimicrobiales bacterium]|nr:MAG: methyltransferase [Acidimicrobiales bacterium]